MCNPADRSLEYAVESGKHALPGKPPRVERLVQQKQLARRDSSRRFVGRAARTSLQRTPARERKRRERSREERKTSPRFARFPSFLLLLVLVLLAKKPCYPLQSSLAGKTSASGAGLGFSSASPPASTPSPLLATAYRRQSPYFFFILCRAAPSVRAPRLPLPPSLFLSLPLRLSLRAPIFLSHLFPSLSLSLAEFVSAARVWMMRNNARLFNLSGLGILLVFFAPSLPNTRPSPLHFARYSCFARVCGDPLVFLYFCRFSFSCVSSDAQFPPPRAWPPRVADHAFSPLEALSSASLQFAPMVIFLLSRERCEAD